MTASAEVGIGGRSSVRSSARSWRPRVVADHHDGREVVDQTARDGRGLRTRPGVDAFVDLDPRRCGEFCGDDLPRALRATRVRRPRGRGWRRSRPTIAPRPVPGVDRGCATAARCQAPPRTNPTSRAAAGSASAPSSFGPPWTAGLRAMHCRPGGRPAAARVIRPWRTEHMHSLPLCRSAA